MAAFPFKPPRREARAVFLLPSRRETDRGDYICMYMYVSSLPGLKTMQKWLIHAGLTTIALLFFTIWFPVASSVAAYIISHAPVFGAAFVLAFLISRQAFAFWWAEHIQLKGVGSKSRWQHQQNQNQGVNK